MYQKGVRKLRKASVNTKSTDTGGLALLGVKHVRKARDQSLHALETHRATLVKVTWCLHSISIYLELFLAKK